VIVATNARNGTRSVIALAEITKIFAPKKTRKTPKYSQKNIKSIKSTTTNGNAKKEFLRKGD
jgi:hypothetical protein